MPRKTYEHLLRKRNSPETAVSYSELLFDLIYVFAVTQLSHFLLHHMTLTGIIQSVILWLGVWMVWQHTIWVTNWFNTYTRSVRMFLFALMIASLFMTAALPHAFGEKVFVFVGSYVCMQIGRTLYVLFLLGGDHSLAQNYRRILVWMCISCAFWIAGAFMGEYARIAMWMIAVLLDFTAPMFGFYFPVLGRSIPIRDWTVDGDLMLERCKLFVMIAFGETILMTGASLSAVETWSFDIVMAAIVSFLGSLAMWWIYFDASSEAASQKIKNSDNPGWLGLKFHAIHAVLVGALIVCAVGDELVVSDPDGRATPLTLYVMVYGPIIYLLANTAFKWLTCRALSVSHMAAIAAFVILIPFSFSISLLALNTISLLIFIAVAAYELMTEKKSNLKGQEIKL